MKKMTIEKAKKVCDSKCVFCRNNLREAKKMGRTYVYVNDRWHVFVRQSGC